MVGELTGLETICFLLISDKIEICTVSVPSPFKPDSEIDLSIRKSKNPRINVDLANGTPNISVDLFLEAHGLTLNDTIDYTSINDVENLKNSAEQYLKMRVTDFLNKTAKEFNSDICGFGKYALSKYLTWNDWENSKWADNYKNSTFSINVNVSVISGSEFDKSP